MLALTGGWQPVAQQVCVVPAVAAARRRAGAAAGAGVPRHDWPSGRACQQWQLSLQPPVTR